ncbi:MAG: DUF721 domain-containing protein [Deltaproteobacteria bacterium]|nr:DUF721 domain-containing protein [Deltaproteobacteria bacterium]
MRRMPEKRGRRRDKAVSGPFALKDVLSARFAYLGLPARLREYAVMKVWPGCVGEGIARRAAPMRLMGGVLYCTVSSPVWMTELAYQKKEIAAKINRGIGEAAVKDIIFKLGNVPEPSAPKQAAPVIRREVSPEERGVIDRDVSVIKDDGLRELIKRVMLRSKEQRQQGTLK